MLEQNKKYAHCLKVCVYVAYGGTPVPKSEPNFNHERTKRVVGEKNQPITLIILSISYNQTIDFL